MFYVEELTLFSIELHRGGRFTKFPNIKYLDGEALFIECVDIDEFYVHEINMIICELGYIVPHDILLFQNDMRMNELWTKVLGNNDDVLNLARYVRDNNVIKVYIKHGSTNLVTYYMSPNHLKA